MYITDVILLVVGMENGHELIGRPLFQKKIYLLSILCNQNFGFKAHYYGPHSGFVSEHINGLVSDKLLDENIQFFTTDSIEQNDLGEKRRHTYSLTSMGKKALKSIKSKDDFQKWNDALNALNGQEIANNFNLISIAAKVHYIIDWNPETSVKDVCKTVKKYGWKFDEADIKKVISFLIALKLVDMKQQNINGVL